MLFVAIGFIFTSQLIKNLVRIAGLVSFKKAPVGIYIKWSLFVHDLENKGCQDRPYQVRCFMVVAFLVSHGIIELKDLDGFLSANWFSTMKCIYTWRLLPVNYACGISCAESVVDVDDGYAGCA